MKTAIAFFVAAKLLALAICLVVMALLTGCGKGSGTPTTIVPPPPQDQYEALPATHQLVGASGKGLKMWITMFSADPLRGSTVGDGAIKAIPIEARNGNKKYGAGFQFYWSRDDKIDSTDENAGTLGVLPNGSQRGNLFRWSGGFAPRYLLIKGRIDGETGETGFFLDYR